MYKSYIRHILIDLFIVLLILASYWYYHAITIQNEAYNSNSLSR